MPIIPRHIADSPATIRPWRLALLLSLMTLVVLIVYRQPLLSGFAVTTGHELDGVIATSLMEHWWNVAKGNAYWETVNYFSPYRHTLGYNDGYLLFGLFHSIFRAWGIDPFLAAEFSLWLLRGIGFITFWGLAHKALNLTYWSAIVGATLFTLSSSAFLQSQHVQLLTINLAPLMAWLMLATWRAFYCRKNYHGSIFALATILLYAIWLLTAFYMAWFFALFALTFTLAVTILAWPMFKVAITKCFNAYWGKRIASIAILSGIAILPFLWVYLPKVQETGGHAYHSALTFMLTPGDLFNIGEQNLIWGSLFTAYKNLVDLNTDNNYELLVGFPPVFFIGILLTTYWLIKKRHQHPLWASLAISSLISLLLIIRIDELSLWWAVWHAVPGASGLRAVARYAIFLFFPLCLLWSFALSTFRNKYATYIIFPLVALLASEQITLAHNAEVPRESYLKNLQLAETPPRQCENFYVTERREDDQHISTSSLFGNLYPHNVAAMFFSEWWNIRTINGFSTFNPPGWSFSYLPESSYYYRVRDYVINHQISEGLCSFNLRTLSWNASPITSEEIIKLKQIRQQPLPMTDQLVVKLTSSEIHSPDENTWRLSVGVENTGYVPLVAKQKNPINLGIQLRDSEGNLITPDLARLPLQTLLPGEQLELPIDFVKERVEGNSIYIALVQEGVAWLDENNPPVAIFFHTTL